jgi:predicted PurR-regulated permease PerM
MQPFPDGTGRSRPWSNSRWLRNGLLLPLWFLNGWLLLRLIAFLQPFLTIFVLALVLAMLLEVPVHRLQRWGFRRGVSLLFVVLAVMLAGSAVLLLILPPLLQETGQLLSALPTWLNSSRGLVARLLELPGIPGAEAAAPRLLEGLTGQLATVGGDLLSTLPNLLSAGMGAGLLTFLTLILTVFLLAGGASAWTGLTRWLPPWWRVRIRSELPHRLGVFLRGQVAIAAGFALVLAIVFSLIGVPFGVLFGIVIGMASMIPFMGAVAQVGVSLFLLMHDLGMGLAVFAIAFVLGQIVDNVVVPRVMGNLVGLNPLWLLFTVFLGAKVAGVPGILVSIPLASTIRVIAEEWISGQDAEEAQAMGAGGLPEAG